MKECSSWFAYVFSINLPIVDPPKWFLNELCIVTPKNIVIFSDDTNFYSVWRKRLENNIVDSQNVSITDLFHTEDLINYHKKCHNINTLYFIDYELFGSNLTGLDIIEKLDTACFSILVTNHYDDDKIRERCIKLGVKILAKYSIESIRIKTIINKFIDSETQVVLLDDNKSIIDVWELQSEISNIKFSAFNNVNEFMQSFYAFSKNAVFYIDSELEDIFKGEKIAEVLYKNGFENIYLSTGHEGQVFSNMKYLKGIVGKKPPF